jgi:hypothetical protein
LLPVKSSFTMSNILIDKRAVQDLILFDKGRNIGKAHAGYTRQSGHLSRRA